MKKKIVAILCLVLMFSLTGCGRDALSYIQEHSKLDLRGKYSTLEVDDTYYSTGDAIYKYEIRSSEIESVRQFIKDNWGDMTSGENLHLPKNLSSPIYKQLDEDKAYCSETYFFWTNTETGAKTDELGVYVVDKGTEMYLVFSAIP